MTLIIFLFTLSILIFVHEFGHFIVAKKNGIRVEEFGMGMPPKAFGKKIGETEYTLNWLPFGGFVKLTGEEVEDEEDEYAQESDPRSFVSKTPLQRAVVIIAGVIMNFILAVLIYYLLFFVTGFKTFTLPLLFDYHFKFGQEHIIQTVVTGVQPGSAADISGVEPGEAVISIDRVKVETIDDVRNALQGKEGTPVSVELLDLKVPLNKEPVYVTMEPQLGKEGNAVIGTYMGDAVYITYRKPLEKLFSGFLQSYNVMDYSLFTMKNIFGISVRERNLEPVSESVAGPVGIYNLVGSILKVGGDSVVLSLMDYVALMSLSLAFINIMPFPALDGGRLLFIIIEKVRGKKVDPALEAKIHRIGITILFGFLILVTIKDLDLVGMIKKFL